MIDCKPVFYFSTSSSPSAHLERLCDYCSVADPTPYNLDPDTDFLVDLDPGVLFDTDPDSGV